MNVVGKFFGNTEWHNILVLLSNGKGGIEKIPWAIGIGKLSCDNIWKFYRFKLGGECERWKFKLPERKNV